MCVCDMYAFGGKSIRSPGTEFPVVVSYPPWVLRTELKASGRANKCSLPLSHLSSLRPGLCQSDFWRDFVRLRMQGSS